MCLAQIKLFTTTAVNALNNCTDAESKDKQLDELVYQFLQQWGTNNILCVIPLEWQYHSESWNRKLTKQDFAYTWLYECVFEEIGNKDES